MLKVKVMGIGAAGNKAVIALIEANVGITKNDVLLINSTQKDIPVKYRDIAFTLPNSLGGCGKERAKAKDLAIAAFTNGTLSDRLDNLFDPSDRMAIIVSSAEGGTGSGASTIITQYCQDVLELKTHQFVFTGFEEDGRGLQNTIEFFQDINENTMVQCIVNAKFLDESKNKQKAENLANEEFVKRVSILIGNGIKDSSQNIDQTDLYKLVNTPGFTTIEYAQLDKIKNLEMFNKLVMDMIDNSKTLDFEPSAKRIGVILNLTDKSYVDYSFTKIKERVGVPFEIFTHVQEEKESKDYIAIIATGINLPIDEVKAIYERYEEEARKINRSRGSFFKDIATLKGNSSDSIFDMDLDKTDKKRDQDLARASFLNKVSKSKTVEPPKKAGFVDTKGGIDL